MYNYSGITVKELLKLESMEGAKVLIGENGLNRRVLKLNVMEVPDIINWVEKGEFLLTTAFSIKDNLDELEKIIVQFNDKGLAGIGIKTKRYIDNIPAKVLEKAKELNFPIIEIPYDISYSYILGEALAEIVSSHANFLNRIDNIQTKLINVMLDGGSLKEIAGAIYGSVDRNSIAIKDFMFENNVILCDEANRKDIESIVESGIQKKETNKEDVVIQSLWWESIDLLGGQEIRRINIPISSGDTEYGYMYIWEDKKDLTPLELNVIGATIPIIALDIYKSLSIIEIESKHRIAFLEDLLSGDESRFNKALEKAPYFRFDIDMSYSVIMISFNNNKTLRKYYPSVQKFEEKLKNIIKNISKSKDQKIICGTKREHTIILYGSSPDKNDKEIRREIKKFSKDIMESLENEGLNGDVSISIGRNYKDAKELWQSCNEAKRAIEYQRKNHNSNIIYYDDLGIYRILSFKDFQGELEQLYRESLESLVTYDKEKGTDLVLTLKKYFEFEGNLKEVSDELFIHYNTAVYRMQRIKEVIGVNFDDYNERLNLQIALKIFEMYDNESLKK